MRHPLRYFLPAAALALSASLSVHAQSTPSAVVVVNGTVQELQLKRVNLGEQADQLGFSHQRVVIVYQKADGKLDAMSVHPMLCQVLFGEGITGIRDVNLFEVKPAANGRLDLSGLTDGQPVRVYNTAGRLCLSTRATDGAATLKLNTLPRGMYLIQAGRQVFKYMNK